MRGYLYYQQKPNYAIKGTFFTERELVGIFRCPNSVAIIWKQAFSKQAGEYVAELVLIQNDDRLLVDLVMVF